MTPKEIREWLLRIEDLNMMHRKNHHKVSAELTRLRKALEAEPLAVVEGWMYKKCLHRTNKRAKPGDIVSGSIHGRGGKDYAPVTVTVTERTDEV